MSVRAIVLTGFGINCDNETQAALNRAGATAERVHLNDIIEAPAKLDEYQIFAVPGGFSFGDDVASGKVLANRLRYKLGEPLHKFVADGKLMIGICNGFQVLVKMGILPMFDGEFKQEVTLTHNTTGRFENRWVHLNACPATKCVWLKDVESLPLPIRHGEGKFIPRDDAVLERLKSNGQVALRYATADGAQAKRRVSLEPEWFHRRHRRHLRSHGPHSRHDAPPRGIRRSHQPSHVDARGGVAGRRRGPPTLQERRAIRRGESRVRGGVDHMRCMASRRDAGL